MSQYPIYCINLEHRKDRKEHSLNQFTNLGISHHTVKYPHFEKDPRGGAYGCFDSHIKIWNDFFINYPNEKYVLIFEDDFEAPNNSKTIIKDAVKFIDNNYDKIDVLFLHNICVDVENSINNDKFTCGYGLGAHAYFVTRHYIKSIIDKYEKLPEPNGRHIDIEICSNIINKDNTIYSDKCFFTTDTSFTQMICESDNYSNLLEKLLKNNQNQVLVYNINILKLLSKTKILNDNQIKIWECLSNQICDGNSKFTSLELIQIAQMFLK